MAKKKWKPRVGSTVWYYDECGECCVSATVKFIYEDRYIVVDINAYVFIKDAEDLYRSTNAWMAGNIQTLKEAVNKAGKDVALRRQQLAEEELKYILRVNELEKALRMIDE